jgi:hypothetical protein
VLDVFGQDLFGPLASGGAGCQDARGDPFDDVADEPLHQMS